MNRNVGAIDRTLRIGVGALLVLLAGIEVIGIWGYLGLVPLVTGLLGTCPAYTLFGVRTCASEGPSDRPGSA